LEASPPAQAQAPVAQLQSHEPIIKLPKAPKSESPTFSKGKKPTKKNLKAFALALAEQFYEASEEEETAESSSHPRQFDPFQDAQDPYDAYDLDLDI
jgi:hypothetical protein